MSDLNLDTRDPNRVVVDLIRDLTAENRPWTDEEAQRVIREILWLGLDGRLGQLNPLVLEALEHFVKMVGAGCTNRLRELDTEEARAEAKP